MKRKYEGVIVLNTKGKDESVDTMVSTVSKELEGFGAELNEVEQLGRKEFIYNARHLEGGFYVNYKFNAEPSAIDEIRKKLKLNNDVFLQHYQRVN